MKLIRRRWARDRVRVALAVALLVLLGSVVLRIGSSLGRLAGGKLAYPASIPTATSSAVKVEQVRAAYARLRLIFEPNQGQADPQVKFVARGTGYGLFLTVNEAVLALRPGSSRSGSAAKAPSTSVLRMQLAGAEKSAVSGAGLLPGKSNYLLGNDPSQWHQNVPQFARVHYANVYPGIDLVYYGTQGQLEYDFEVAPGADPRRVTLRFDGQQDAHIEGNGDLVLRMGGGDLRLHAPRVYQKIGEQRQPVKGTFVLRDRGQVGFAVGEYDPSRTLVIDPVLTYSTYLGGSGAESCSAILGLATPPLGCPSIAVDGAFNIYIAGATTSADFPLTPAPVPPATGPLPFQSSLNGPADVFVTKLNNTGSAVVFSTYLGGSGTDYPAGIAVNAGFNAIVAGNTDSGDFPTNGTFAAAFETAPRVVGTHGFVTELAADGSALAYSTYLSGNGTDVITGVALDPKGKIYVTGNTTSTDDPNLAIFPATLGSFQMASKATTQFFLSKIDPAQSSDASLPFSTYFGGSTPTAGIATGGGIAVETTANSLGQYNVYFTGSTNFQDFPILNAYQGCLNGPPTASSCAPTTARDAFVAKLNPAASTGAELIYSTYLGGSGDDAGTGVALDSTPNVYVTGSTTSTDFVIPTSTTPFQSANAGGTDAFLAKFGPPCTGTTCTTTNVPLNYFSYLGGTGADVGTAIAVDASQGARITGSTASSDFHTLTAIQGSSGGGTDAFVTRIDTTATSATAAGHFSSYLGGGGTDIGTGIATDPQGATYLVGETASGNFPVASAFQGSLSGPSDAFVTKLTPSINLALTVTATPNPVGIGNQVTFTYTITNNGDQTNGITFTDFLAAGATFVSASGPSSSSCGTTPVNNTITCNIGTLNSGATATVIVHITPTVGGLVGNNAQISVPGSNFTATAGTSVSLTDFAITASPASNTVLAGVPAAYTATVSPTGSFPDAVTLSCSSGLPSNSSCSVTNGNTIPNLTTGPQSRQIVIATTARPTTGAWLHRGGSFYAMWLPVSGLALFGFGMGGMTSRKRRALLGILLAGLFSMIVFQAACSSGSSTTRPTGGTPAGTYTINITATSGSASRSTPVILVVQ